MQERIRSSFFPDGCGRAVTGEDCNVVAQREQFLLNPLEQLRTIPSWQVPSPDAAGEENVATDEEAFRAGQKAKAARAMSWNFQYLKSCAEKFPFRRFLDEEIWRDGLKVKAEPEFPKKIWICDHGPGIRVATYRAVKFPLNFCHVADMIDMSVGKKKEL